MLLFLLSLLLAPIVFASIQIVPGASITTTNAPYQHMQAHGGGIILADGLYYQIGENKLNGSLFQSVNCYSSPDLVNWKFVNELLTVNSGPADLASGRVVERPHVIYNSETGKYVMWMHIDDSSYATAKAGVATSSTVCGDYSYIGSVAPLGFQSRDMNLFQDTSGTAYLLTEDRVNGMRIDLLSSDYLTVLSATYLWPNPGMFEAPAILKVGNIYYMFASRESGWSPNDNLYCTSTSLTGPWSAWALFAPSGTDTYQSQTAAVVSINGVPMYQGDRWVAANLLESTYVWLPLTLSGTTATLHNEVNWILDIAAGTWSVGPSETYYEAEASGTVLANGARYVACTGCSNATTVGYLGGPSPGGTLTISGISSSIATTTTVRIHYTNADSTQRYANVVVNGVAYIVAFIPTGDDNTPGSAVLTVPLNKGTGNTFIFEAYNAGWAPNIDRIMVPVS